MKIKHNLFVYTIVISFIPLVIISIFSSVKLSQINNQATNSIIEASYSSAKNSIETFNKDIIGTANFLAKQKCVLQLIELSKKHDRLNIVDSELQLHNDMTNNRITSYNVCYTKLLRPHLKYKHFQYIFAH